MASSLTFNLPEHEQLVSCPYNKAHQVVQHRLHRHVIKCKRSHGGVGFKECMFNNSHIFPDAEIAEHEAICPERASLERALHNDVDRQRSHIASADSGFICAASFHVDNEEEDWDDEPPVATYDPRKKIMDADILRDIKHGTPAQREKRREQERQRLTKVRGMIGASCSSTSM